MIILSATTDKVQVILGGAVTTNQLNCYSSWRDITTTAYIAGRTGVLTNGANDVDIVPAPGSNTQRVADYLSVYNNDTAAATVTVKLDANGTEYILWKATLAAGEKLEYLDGAGFRVLDSSGFLKANNAATAVPITTDMSSAVLASPVVNNNASANTIADVTGLSFPVVDTGVYWFKFFIRYTSVGTATGSRWTINGPAFSALNYRSIYTLTATTMTTNFATAYDIPAACNASSLATGNTALIEGIITMAAAGDVIARFASESSGQAITALAGSVVYYHKVA